MEHAWRWFGPKDPIRLDEICQTGATGIVTALHEVPNDEAWSLEAIREHRGGRAHVVSGGKRAGP